MATSSNDNSVKIWDPNNNWILIRNYTNHSSSVRSIEYVSKDLMASGSWDFTIQIWSISTGLTQQTINALLTVYCLQILPTSGFLAAGVFIKIHIYNLSNNGSLAGTLSGHTGNVHDLVVISSDLIASSSSDFSVRIWNLTTNTQKFLLNSHTNAAYTLKFVYFDIIASGSWDNTIKLWNITNGTLIRTLSNHTNLIWYSLGVLNNGQSLVSGSNDLTIKIWNWRTGECLNTINTGLGIQALGVLNLTKTSTTSK